MNSTSTTLAADGDDKTTFYKLDISGVVSGNLYSIDDAFATEHGISVPAPFEFVAPTSDDHDIYVQPRPGGTSYIKLHFVNKDKSLLSDIQFVPIKIPTGELATRAKTAEDVLRTTFLSSVSDSGQSEILVVHNIELAGNFGVELLGRFKDPKLGIVVKRLTIILNSNEENSLFIEINAAAEILKFKKIEEIYGTIASLALSTLKFK